MLKFRSIATLVTLCAITLSFAQEEDLFIPREILQAYDAGTRSMDGSPGPNYWHNTVDYVIDANVDPYDRVLTGTASITYHNNSPDSLLNIVFRLYPDVLKKGGVRDYPVGADDLTDGVDINRIVVADDTLDLESRAVSRRATNLYIRLPQTLHSGESLDMQISWSQPMPDSDGRQGFNDSTSSMVAYWYPQVSVYDDLFGWDQLFFTYQKEFYNNLGNYDVRITIPEEFTVWATGELQNAKDIFNSDLLDKYNNAWSSDDKVEMLTADDFDGDFKYRSGTWHYKASEVSDFAFAFSDHYAWDAASLEVDGRRVLVNAVYPAGDDDTDYSRMIPEHTKMMKHMSEDFPGIPYPYPVFTTYIGSRGGGMEFPMMANNGGPGLRVSIHEMFHTYFPMYVRINERRFAWMDEGWADFTDAYIAHKFFYDESEAEEIFISSLGEMHGSFAELPLITQTRYLDGSNYGYASYPLPGMVFWLLYDYLGEDLFTRCLQTYIREWAKKSPMPYDLFFTFERVSGKDLSWFWEEWFFEFGYADVSVERIKKNKIEIENKGEKPVPVFIEFNYNDGSVVTGKVPMDHWEDEDEYVMKIPDHKDLKYVFANRQLADFNTGDNVTPSIEELYARSEDYADVIGTYLLGQYGINIYIIDEEGSVKLYVPAQGVKEDLLPAADGGLTTLDEAFVVEVLRDAEKVTGLNIAAFGTNFLVSRVDD